MVRALQLDWKQLFKQKWQLGRDIICIFVSSRVGAECVRCFDVNVCVFAYPPPGFHTLSAVQDKETIRGHLLARVFSLFSEAAFPLGATLKIHTYVGWHMWKQTKKHTTVLTKSLSQSSWCILPLRCMMQRAWCSPEIDYGNIWLVGSYLNYICVYVCVCVCKSLSNKSRSIWQRDTSAVWNLLLLLSLLPHRQSDWTPGCVCRLCTTASLRHLRGS